METILRFGTEGESLTLFGVKNNLEEWTYFIESNGTGLAYLLDEEDQDLLPLLNQRRELEENEIDTVLECLGQEWRNFHTLEVHPDFVWPIYKQVLKNPPNDLSHWKRLCLSNNPLYRLAQWMLSSQYTVVLSGAGMSTESGLPDFRSKDGWWKRLDPYLVANIDTLEDNYELFRDFYKYRIETVEQYAPHEGHRILAKWEREGILQGVATQNVDGYHAEAGSRLVSELHGSIRSICCHHCGKATVMTDFLNGMHCSSCKGMLRPNVVLFGERLPEDHWEQAISWFRDAELVIVIGTSLQVAPASQLPKYTLGRTVYLNLEVPAEPSGFDLMISGKALRLLLELNEMIEMIRSGGEG